MSQTPDPKTALVLGATGFLGRYIVRYLAQQGWQVVGIGRSTPENAPQGDLLAYHRLNLPDPQFAELLQRYCPRLCVHAVGRASVGLSMTDPRSDFYEGPVVTFEVLEALRSHLPTCKFIFLSSAAVYGNPTSLPVSESQSPKPLSPYGFHKWQSEQLCVEYAQLYHIPTASVRIFSAYGPGLRRQVVWDICRKVLTQPSLTLQGTGQESRDFIHALDVARAIAIVADQSPLQGDVYNLACGKQVAIATLAELILHQLQSSQSPDFDGQIPIGTPRNWQADITTLTQLGFSPHISLEQGIAAVAQWSRIEIVGFGVDGGQVGG